MCCRFLSKLCKCFSALSKCCPSLPCPGVTNTMGCIQACNGTGGPHRPSLGGCLALISEREVVWQHGVWPVPTSLLRGWVTDAGKGGCQIYGGPTCPHPHLLLLSAYSEEGAAPGDSSEYWGAQSKILFRFGDSEVLLISPAYRE